MFEYWDREPTEMETEELLQKMAATIIKRRLEAPAILALEMHKPVANVGAHAALAFSPFIAPFVGAQNLGDYSAVLRKRSNIDRLIDILSEPLPDRAMVKKK